MIEAEISLNTKNTMKLYFERLEDATYTYILKFADKDIIISNGKVVEWKNDKSSKTIALCRTYRKILW